MFTSATGLPIALTYPEKVVPRDGKTNPGETHSANGITCIGSGFLIPVPFSFSEDEAEETQVTQEAEETQEAEGTQEEEPAVRSSLPRNVKRKKEVAEEAEDDDDDETASRKDMFSVSDDSDSDQDYVIRATDEGNIKLS